MMLMAEKPKEAIGPFKKASLEKEIFISIAHFEHNKIQEGANYLADDCEMKMQIQLFSKTSPLNAAALFWVGTVLSGNIFVAVANSMNFESFFFGTCCLFVLFLIQLKTAMIIGECFVKTNSKIHSIILILLCVLHGLLMLGDLSLQIWTILGQCCIIISIFLFLLTGIYLMAFHHGPKGVIVASFSLIAWIQPLILVAIQQ